MQSDTAEDLDTFVVFLPKLQALLSGCVVALDELASTEWLDRSRSNRGSMREQIVIIPLGLRGLCVRPRKRT